MISGYNVIGWFLTRLLTCKQLVDSGRLSGRDNMLGKGRPSSQQMLFVCKRNVQHCSGSIKQSC